MLRALAVKAAQEAIREALKELGGVSKKSVRSVANGVGKIKFTGSVEGVTQLSQQFSNAANLKQKDVTRAAKVGANIVLKDAKANSPVEIGNLKKSLRLVPEKSRHKKGKKVYQITHDRAYNKFLVKEVKNAGKYGGKSNRAYIPASQNYGFKTSPKAGGYIPGYQYLEKALKENEALVQKTIEKELEKALKNAFK